MQCARSGVWSIAGGLVSIKPDVRSRQWVLRVRYKVDGRERFARNIGQLVRTLPSQGELLNSTDQECTEYGG